MSDLARHNLVNYIPHVQDVSSLKPSGALHPRCFKLDIIYIPHTWDKNNTYYTQELVEYHLIIMKLKLTLLQSSLILDRDLSDLTSQSTSHVWWSLHHQTLSHTSGGLWNMYMKGTPTLNKTSVYIFILITSDIVGTFVM